MSDRSRAGGRGVSEVVSFALVFSLVMATVGIVYVSGLGGLEDARDGEQFTNAERAFDVLADNFEDVYREDAPSRATEIKLSDAQLTFTDATVFTVSIDNVSEPTTYKKSLDPLTYTTDGDSAIVYEAGAVFRRDGSSGIMKRSPPFLFTVDGTERRAILPIVQTRASGPSSVAGSTTVLVRAENSVNQPLAALTNATADGATRDVDGDGVEEYDVEFTLDTSPTRAPLWEHYLEERIPWSEDACSVSGGTVTCSVAVDQLYVTWAGINVELKS